MSDAPLTNDLVLKDCPFCGAAARWCADDEHACHRIVCDGCELSVDCNDNPDTDELRELQVIMAQRWNHRA